MANTNSDEDEDTTWFTLTADQAQALFGTPWLAALSHYYPEWDFTRASMVDEPEFNSSTGLWSLELTGCERKGDDPASFVRAMRKAGFHVDRVEVGAAHRHLVSIEGAPVVYNPALSPQDVQTVGADRPR